MNRGNEFPDLISAGAQALVTNASRLGITWRLRLATVAAGSASSEDFFLARMDGDDETILVISMIGSQVVGTRVYVITIPPAGNYAIGWVSGSSGRFPGQRIATAVETTDSGTFTAETEIGSITATLVTGRTYQVLCNAQVSSSVANDTVLIRLREDTVAGTTIALNTGDVHTTGNIPTICSVEAEYVALVDGDKTFVVSAQRLTGTGNIRREAAPIAAEQLFYVNYLSG